MIERNTEQDDDQSIQAALKYYLSGQLHKAEAICKKLISETPRHSDALHLLGMIAFKTNNHDMAINLIGRAIRTNANNSIYYNNLGEVYRVSGMFELALEAYQKAVSLQPGFAGAYNNLGIVFKNLRRYEQAIACYQKAVSINPKFVEAHYNLGNILHEQGRLKQSIASFREAISINPDFAEAYYGLANALHKNSNRIQALNNYRKTVSINPDFAEAYCCIGNILQEQNRYEEACSSYLKALSVNPEYMDAYSGLGCVYKNQGKHDDALACLQKAITLKPFHEKAHYNLGVVYKELGCHREALASYRRALELNPDFAKAKWAYVIGQIPVIYGADDDPDVCRQNFSKELSRMKIWFDENRTKLGYQAVGSHQPFFLAYEERNNRDLLSQYGSLCARLMESWKKEQGLYAANFATGVNIRVGIVSAHIIDHSVWNAIVKGWFNHIDRNRFQLYTFYLDSKQDDETSWARKRSALFVQGPMELHQWADIILSKQLDILIYPEIGMDQMTVRLASLRLAPVQIATWGHPETTGLPTIDYFLSAEGLEPHNAQANYTEQLVLLPNLGCTYHPLPVKCIERDIKDIGIDKETPVLLCPGTPFKYAPEHDRIYIEIARRLERCQFVFFTHDYHHLTDKFRQRLELAFENAALDFHGCVQFIPWQEKPAYFTLMKRAQVMLDTIGFSGFNTAMQAMESGLPLITMEGLFMRGRLASGILRRMGMPMLIANDQEDYIAKAVSLVRDTEYRKAICCRIVETRHLLFDDLAPVRALEDFLSIVAGKARGMENDY